MMQAIICTTFGGSTCKIRNAKGDVMGRFQKIDGTYKVEHKSSYLAATATNRKTLMSLHDLHERMGHISPIVVRDLVWKGMIEGMELTDGNVDFQCRPCILAKTKRSSVAKEREGEQGEAFGDEIHLDLWGPVQVKTFGGRSHFISFMDDWSRWTTVYLLKMKGEAFSSY
jgi:hypothetical protein